MHPHMETTHVRWSPGTHITVRNIWQGRIFSAYPVVVADTADLIATYVPAGAGWKRPVDFQGRAIRIPHGEWRLRDEVWYGHGVLRIFIPGVAHSVLVFFGPTDVDRWYINLEAPLQRTPIGLDARDQFLDVVFSSNLSTYRVKDEPELDEALSLGLIDAREAASIRAEAQRVIAWIQQGHPAIQDYWRWWQPPTSWTEPQLAPGWEMVD